MSKRYTLGVLAYLVPTFALGFVWHLVLFKEYYESLAIYRADIIIPLGFLSMLVRMISRTMAAKPFRPRHMSIGQRCK
jgi:hypothetical protein